MRTPGQLLQDKLCATDIADVALRIATTPSLKTSRQALYPYIGRHLYSHPLVCFERTATVTTLLMWLFGISITAQRLRKIDGLHGARMGRGIGKAIPHLKVAFQVIDNIGGIECHDRCFCRLIGVFDCFFRLWL